MVAAVGGPAVGTGTTLPLHCALVSATPAARSQLPFVQLGIVPEFGSTYLLPLIAGYQRAAELLLLGQPFTAQKAYEVGMITAVVGPEKINEREQKNPPPPPPPPPRTNRPTQRPLEKPAPTRPRP